MPAYACVGRTGSGAGHPAENRLRSEGPLAGASVFVGRNIGLINSDRISSQNLLPTADDRAPVERLGIAPSTDRVLAVWDGGSDGMLHFTLPVVYPMEPLGRALLRGVCRMHGWDANAIEDMATGRTAASNDVVDLFARLFGIPRKAWPIPPRVVSEGDSPYRQVMGEPATEELKAILRANGRKRRYLTTPVHHVLDQLDWSVADLARHVSDKLGKRIPRASMQFWATGTRQIGPKGKSYSHAVQAPLEVRIAAEKITARVALRRGLGEKAVLMRNIWPNVEDE